MSKRPVPARPAVSGDPGLVPLADRLFWMQVVRACVAVAVLGGSTAYSGSLGTGQAEATAAYLAASLVPTRAHRIGHRSTVTLFGLALLVDGVYLAVTTYGAAGIGSALQYLVVVHLVAATLLGSFRTGLKLTLWHSMLATTAFQLERDGVLGADL